MRVWGMLLFLCVGCGAGKSAKLVSGDYTLAFSDDGATAELLRQKSVLLRFDGSAFQLGVVPALDPSLNYDPYQAEPESDTGYPPDGLIWQTPSSHRIVSATSDSVTLAL